MKTIAEYQKNLKTNNKNLIPSDYSTETYLAPYFATGMPSRYDLDYMAVRYASLELVSEDPETLEQLVITAIESHAYKWDKLFKTLSLEYNPIWNVDGTETTVSDIAERHSTMDNGQKHSTSENSEKPFDTDIYKDTNKNELTNDSSQDEVTQDAYIDTVTLTRQGNIGVTKTQDLIESEREVADFVYMDVVMKDIIDNITYPRFI